MLQQQLTTLSSISRLTEVKARFTTNIMLIGASFIFLYTIIYFYLEAYLAAFTCLISLVVFVPLIMFAIHKKQLLIARVTTVSVTVAVVVITSIALHNQARTEYYFLPAMMLSLLLFDPDQKNAVIFSLFLPIFGWLITHIDISTLEKNGWLAPNDFPFLWLAIINFIGALTLTYIFLRFYSQAMLQTKEIEIEHEQKIMHSSKLVSMGQLAGGIAHEINNPLAIIMGRTQLLKAKFEKNEAQNLDRASILQNLEKIENTAALITKIIKGLNAFSRNSDRDPLEKAPVSQIISYALELCEDRIKQAEVRIRTNYDTEQYINCREFQIAQVIVNLINNSIDAIEALPEKWILIDSKQDSEWVYISITDSGEGIESQLLDKIMLPFFSTKQIGKGIGLGLSISKGIIEAHGGRLYYDEKNTHTRFTIQMPHK